MIRFAQTLNEDKGGKNLHLEHLEDEIINFGVDGGRAAINFLRSLRDMLAGASRSSVNMTVKFDGAPAIFAGKCSLLLTSRLNCGAAHQDQSLAE